MFVAFLYALRLTFLNSLNMQSAYAYSVKFFVTATLFYLFLTMTVLNYLLDSYSDICILSSDYLNLKTTWLSDKLVFTNSNSLQLLDVYLYPFIYVFLVVTALSIVFCLTYNSDELATFMFYCMVILLSGYSLFFTDSMVIFFFSYEMLLIPSFFILYKFAKTRRCVEAAYLMFFWTQFGALFLILAFLYLFFICGSSSFSSISNTYLSPFEVNFIFICMIMGFGVKLPIWPFLRLVA